MVFKQTFMKKKALSLIELMITVAIVVIGLTSILASYANMFILGDLARDFSRATNAVRAQMEEIKQEEFDNLDALDATIFNLDGFAISQAKGRIEVGNVTGNSGLREVRVIGCFMSRNRVIGEDSNLNGILDVLASEDENNNGRLDCPVELITLLAD